MMSDNYDFDVAVIGAGPAGYVAGIRAAQLGARACVVEKSELGGVCTNVGCIPTKALWHSSRMLLRIERAAECGLDIGGCELNYAAVASRRDAIVKKLRGGVKALLSGKGVELIQAVARFKDPHTLHLDGPDGERDLRARNVIIATGSRPVELREAPFDHEVVVDSADAVSANELPESVVIVGGGYIGIEFAGIYAAFGIEVVVIEAMDRILPGVDEDCARQAAKGLKRLGVCMLTGLRLESVSKDKGGVRAKLTNGEEVTAQRMLVCVGRRADCSGLDLERAGLQAGEQGQLSVNEHMQTAQPHVYAAGDVVGHPMLAHAGSREGIVAASHATGSLTAAMDYRVVPACAFAFPEIGTVGLTEDEARESVGEIVVKKFPLLALGKAHILGETDGFVKMLADAKTGELLGVHICGPEASSLIGEAALAMQLECTAEELAETIHAHPTLPEALQEAAEGLVGVPVNWRG